MSFGVYIMINEYIAEMEKLYDMHKDLQNKYVYGATDDLPELEDYDYRLSLKFTRTWEIIKSLNGVHRNIYLAFIASGKRYDKMIELMDASHQNKAVLRVMVCKAKQMIKEKYKDEYGTD